jgi:hypothetical protein
MSVAYLIPAVDPMVDSITTMVATTAAMLRKPLLLAHLVALLMPVSLLEPITVCTYGAQPYP